MEKEIENLREKLEKSETLETKPDTQEGNDNADENYKCDFCDFKAKSEGGLKTHKRAKHKNESIIRYAESSIEENDVSPVEVSARSISLHPKFKCYLCNEFLPTISDLMNHHNGNHNDHPNKLVCEDCAHI